MIKVERLDKSEFYINYRQILKMEETPDTVITLITEEKLVVTTKIAEIIKRIVEYRKIIGASFSSDR